MDEDALTRGGIRAIISASHAVRSWDELADMETALARLPHSRPDLVLVEASLAAEHQGKAVRAILRSLPEAKVIAFGAGRREEEIFHVLDAGAVGYVTRCGFETDLVAAVRQAQAGHSYIPPAIQCRLQSRMERPTLTPRETQVLELLAEAHSNSTIATLLQISTGTVKLHVKSVLAKLGVDDRTAAGMVAWERGFARSR